MERISAACAMEWSIELDKSLRSKHPGRPAEAIIRMGPRLVQWSREPEPGLAVCDMFSLVPGEDRLFANAILLHLADAFRFGDRERRISVVKVFLSELRSRGKVMRNKQYKGILSKARVRNPSELIRRVRAVFDAGDVESRVLALVLFGCWADFTKDSAHVRYLILSSMVSSDVLEVKASFFAAGCLCGSASDFASVVLEMLVNIISSTKILLTIRLAGARLFAKLGCSYPVANKAYKTGLKLAIDSLEEELLAALMVSLSRLASRWTILLSEQVDFLLSFFNQEKSVRLQETSIRCLHFIFVGVHHSPVSAQAIRTLLRISHEPELPSAMQCEALHVTYKLLLCGAPSLTFHNMPECALLLEILEKSTESPLLSKSLLAIRLLVDASLKLKQETQMVNGEDCPSSPLIRIVPTVIDRIILLLKPLLDLCQSNRGTIHEIQGLLNLLLLLVKENPEQGILVMDKLRSFIVEIVDFRGDKGQHINLKFVCSVHKLLLSCIEDLNDLGAITSQVLEKVNLLINCVTCCSSFGSYEHIIYSIFSHSQIMWNLVLNSKENISSLEENSGKAHSIHLVEREIFTLACARKMSNEKDNWPAYKAGKLAACQGSWVTAAFIFQQLITEVQSHSCSCWLKSLYQFAQSEKKIQLLILSSLVNRSLIKEPAITTWDSFMGIGHGSVGNIYDLNHIEVLIAAYHDVSSSSETLQAVPALGNLFCFQSWFLDLRSKLLAIVVDVLKILGNIPLNQDEIVVDCLKSVCHITRKSYQLKELAEKFDLVAKSFIDIDSRSSQIISALALRCSLLAFIVGFPLFIQNLLSSEVSTSGVDWLKLQGVLTRDLIGRIWLSDEQTYLNLCQVLEIHKRKKDNCDFEPRNQTSYIGGELKGTISLCDYAIAGLLGLHDAAKSMDNEENALQVTKDGLQLLLRTIMKWLQIPFRLPKYFFIVRPCIGSELFVFNADAKKRNELTVLAGSHISLNLCLQLKNVPSNLPFRLKKLYCILGTSQSFQEPGASGETMRQVQLDYRSWETDNMVRMNRQLLCYVTEHRLKSGNGKRIRDEGMDEDGVVSEVACFEMYNKWQGFSSCLLDVSQFPVGCYRIKWHSCCIDEQGCYWSLLPLNSGPVFTVEKHPVGG